MLLTFEETAKLIKEGKTLHLAGNATLLQKLPKGNWIGGSTEYFMEKGGGKITDNLVFVDVLPYTDFRVAVYTETTLADVAKDAYDNGFSIVIMPFDSAVHKLYAGKAPEFSDIFIKNIVGWIAGTNLLDDSQTPAVFDGVSGEVFSDRAVVLHLKVPDDRIVSVGIVNIFSQDTLSPTIQFDHDGFSVTKALIDGQEVNFAEYLVQNNIDTRLPLVGDYSGAGVNISFKIIENDVVYFYTPVFAGIQYKLAQKIGTYVDEFERHLKNLPEMQSVFSCNCILNFLYGKLEGKEINNFYGSVAFGEIAYQLLNQTLVYVTVSE
jgi:hypothetical protein